MSLLVGEIVSGIIENITKFGLFVRLPDGSIGLVHISEVSNQYIKDLHQLFKLGKKVKVKVLKIKNGKISLSIKQVAENDELHLFDKNQDFYQALADFLYSSQDQLDQIQKKIKKWEK